MIGLPESYRFSVWNASGVTLAAGAVKVYARRRKISGSDGQLVYEAAEATVFSNAATLATATLLAGATISNATDKWLSGDFIFEVTAAGAPNGDVFLYLERSTDGGAAHWPDGLFSAIVSKILINSTATRRVDFSI